MVYIVEPPQQLKDCGVRQTDRGTSQILIVSVVEVLVHIIFVGTQIEAHQCKAFLCTLYVGEELGLIDYAVFDEHYQDRIFFLTGHRRASLFTECLLYALGFTDEIVYAVIDLQLGSLPCLIAKYSVVDDVIYLIIGSQLIQDYFVLLRDLTSFHRASLS
jgi:hypothetical protein